MHGDDLARLEAKLLADLLAHVDGRAAEFDRRLTVLERGGHGTLPHSGVTAGARAEAESLYRSIRRLSAAMALVEAYMQVRREQLAAMRRAANC
jgi:hypothetical protein